ncbi:polymorphic toxin-type HINT domain-containing protein [Paenibacillus sp. 481]|uniref:polymorphic toxin-type HINT domain-containing protein n=1 Tax=Paenibacillus sp. 481 TaxID=2835869 RepID=UPI001E58EC28|nr:polymorphic toxin-type HINT domain-containing protein [Paenibacillus sp. 481]UHA73729.1 wall-associated protein WapA [Paenibacillus sp. 481]
MKKYISVILAFMMVFTSLPLASAQPLWSEDNSTSTPRSVTEAVYDSQPADLKPEDIITISSVANQFNVTGDWVYEEIKKGYRLHHIYEGLQEKQKGGSYEQYMKQLYPNVIQKPLDERNTGVTSSVYGDLNKDASVEGNSSVTNAVYPVTNSRKKRSASGEYDNIALKQKQLKFDHAPFSIGDVNEQISTVDGSLQIQNTDLILPGPNGLDFELRRVYDSSRGKDDTFYDWSEYKQSTKRTEEDYRTSLGKGWMWDIPYFKEDGDQKFIYIPGKGTFGIADNYEILGYPFGDLSFGPSYGEPEGTVFALTDATKGLRYTFSADGFLKQINDKHGNFTEFVYDGYKLFMVATFSNQDVARQQYNVLFIKDYDDYTLATASYKDPATNTYQERKVKYVKNKININGREHNILKEVIDPVGRSTKYYYDVRNTMFFNILKGYDIFTDFSDRMMYWGKNTWVTLGMIEHPTKAQTKFETSEVLREIGVYAQEEQVRYEGRKRLYSTNTGAEVAADIQKLTFHRDIGQTYGDQSFSVSVDDGLTLSKYNYSLDYREDYHNLDDSSTYQFPPDSPLMYTDSVEVSSKRSNERKVTGYGYDTYSNREERHTNPTQVTETSYGPTGASHSKATRYTYDDYGYVLTETNSLNVTSHLEYGYAAGYKRLKKSTVPVGPKSNLVTEYEYDQKTASVTQVAVHNGQGQQLSQVNYDYDLLGNPTTIQIKGDGSRNTVVKQEFNQEHKYRFVNKQTVTVTDANGNASDIVSQNKIIPETGNLYQFIDGKGQVVTYSYDHLNRITSETYHDGTQTKIVYDDAQNKVTVTSPTGEQSEWLFDPFGRLIKETNGRGSANHTYDEFNHVIVKGNANGSSTHYKYDAWGRVIEEKPGHYEATRFLYDDGANTKTTIDGANNTFKETYDVLGRLLLKEEVKPGGNVELARYVYDYAGNVTSMADGNNNVTKYEYDALSRLVAVTDAEGKTTKYKYNLTGDMVEVQYPDGNIVQKKYDEIGRLVEQLDPKQQSKKLYYDANDNVVRSVDRKGQTQQFEYNNRDLLTSSITADETITYAYDAAGKRLSMKDNTGTTNYNYHPTGELKTITYHDGIMLSYDYEGRGLRTKQSVSAGSFNLTSSIDYLFDYPTPTKLSVMDGSGNALSQFTYEFDQRSKFLSKLSGSNGYTESYKYDGLNMIDIQQQLGGNTFGQYTYNYDKNRNIVGKNDNGAGYQYTYDKLNRIQTNSQFNETYAYDNRDNRSTLTTDHTPEIKGGSYTYDQRNRLTSVTTDEGKTVTYRYNGDNLMVERTENGETTRYYYDDNDKIVAEAKVENGSVTILAGYVYDANDDILARQVPGKGMQYYITNGHGDVTEIRDEQGNVLNKYTYDIWGNPLNTPEEKVPNIFRYSGEYWDATTGLQYLRERWYDPSIGRFINEDTYEGEIDSPLSLNLYTYVLNNPLIFVDPTGNVAQFAKNAWNGVKKGARVAGRAAVSTANFLVLDDLRVISDPNTSMAQKGMAIATTLIPAGKVLKAGKAATNVYQASKAKKAQKAKTGCNCFVAGTMVLTDEGEKNIEDIEVGDKVLSKNEETGEQAYKEVTHLYRNDKEIIYELTVGDQVIETTDNHPFWVEGKGWVLAADLHAGDKLQQSNGNILTIDKINIVKHDEMVKVYNFTVADFHTYFVSDLGIWVHNINKFCGSASDLADLARKSKKNDGLQGAKVSADLIYDASIDFVGKGAKVQKIDGGMLYTSKDGLKSVRTGKKYGKGVYEANFESFDKRGNRLTNYHVEIE